MLLPSKSITVFEFGRLHVGTGADNLAMAEFQALASFHDKGGKDFYSLIYNGIQFNSYVGVLQVGSILIEVLPKTDNNDDDFYWRNILVGMLRISGLLNIKTPTSSTLKIRRNSILDIYIELFLNELEYLLHSGLVKKYRVKEENRTSVKGSIVFNKHIQQNLVHQERVFTRATVFDNQHLLNSILYKALNLVQRICTSSKLHSQIGSLKLRFPEMNDVAVNEQTFQKIILNRRTQHYKKGLEIARMLLLNYHPDIQKGNNSVLALMFDMNVVWEKFVFRTLFNSLSSKDYEVKEQVIKPFWQPEFGSGVSVKPDIVIRSNDRTVVLDTKWKILDSFKMNIDDLRQMYVYHKYFISERVCMIHPGREDCVIKGEYVSLDNKEKIECSLIQLPPDEIIIDWQRKITEKILSWIEN